MFKDYCKTLPGLTALAALCLQHSVSHADVTFYDSLLAFQAVTTSNVAITFDPYSPTNTNIYSSLTFGGITFVPLDESPSNYPPNLYIAAPSSTEFGVPTTSNVLTASGNEHFGLQFSSSLEAVGFDTYTNFSSTKPIVSVYDTANTLIGTYTLTQSTNSLGFVGITSDVPIGQVIWLAHQGDIQDTAIDNVRVGTLASVPEANTVVVVLVGLVPGMMLLTRRHRK